MRIWVNLLFSACCAWRKGWVLDLILSRSLGPDPDPVPGYSCISGVHFPLTQQSTKDGVADRHRHPGWLFRVEDGNEEFQHPLSPGILTVGNGEPVFRVCGIPEFSANESICSRRKPLPFGTEPIRFSPFLHIPSFWPCSNNPFILVWGSYG